MGTVADRLSSNLAEAGMFYAATNQGLFRSPDAGLSWARLDLDCTDAYRQQHVLALGVVEGG